MIKYIYYRMCRHHEKGKRKNVPTYQASQFTGMVYFIKLLPFILLFMALMSGYSKITVMLSCIPFLILDIYLSTRFEKRMETYRPPKRYKKLNRISKYTLAIVAVFAFLAYSVAVFYVMMEYVIKPFHLDGWVANHLFKS